MYPPNRHQVSLFIDQNPPQNSQHHAKEVISELCDRIKNEYTSMYAHIQNLKNELEKATSQRADFERYYSANQDMAFVFNNEAGKMADIIKRLVQAISQQLPYLPPELQNHSHHLIEQVKLASVNETPGIPLMHVSQMPPPHVYPPPHPAHLPASGPSMHPPHPHMVPSFPPHGSMVNFMNRLPMPPPHFQDSREHYPLPPPDMPRYKDKDYPPGNLDTFIGMPPRDQSISSHNLAKPIVFRSTPGRSGETENGPDHEMTDSLQKERENGDPSSEQPTRPHLENDSSSHTDSEKSATPNTSDLHSNSVNNHQNIKKTNTEHSPQKNNSIAPNIIMNPRQPDSLTHYQRPLPPQIGPSSRPGSHNKAPKPPMNGSYMPMPHNIHHSFDGSHPYHVGVPSYPPRPPSMTPSFDPVMVHRANIPMGPYGPIHSYNVPAGPYPSYGPPVESSDLTQSLGPSRLPKSFAQLSYLQHGDVVCAVSFSSHRGYVFTGSKGVVKIWDISDLKTPRLLSSIDCLKDNYVRACKSINDNKLLVVSGEHSSVGLWSLTPNDSSGLSVNTVGEMVNPSPVCYNMAISPDEKFCYCCCSSGTIVGWDIETSRPVRSLSGHVDGATSIDITRDGSLVWSGGLDSTTRCWDTREAKQVHSFSYPTQVFSLCISPASDFLVAGLENKTIELCYTPDSHTSRTGERHVFKVHDSCVLTVKIANSGRWLLSSSKDNYTNCVALPAGSPLFVTREGASILCTDISSDDRFVITGGGEKKATIYECVY